jgi:hypothetical protein
MGFEIWVRGCETNIVSGEDGIHVGPILQMYKIV